MCDQRKDAKYKFDTNLLALSENKDVDMAKKEWHFVTKDKVESEQCICQRKISNVIYMWNHVTGKSIAVGTTCCEKFLEKTHVTTDKKFPPEFYIFLKKEISGQKGEYQTIADLNIYSDRILKNIEEKFFLPRLGLPLASDKLEELRKFAEFLNIPAIMEKITQKIIEKQEEIKILEKREYEQKIVTLPVKPVAKKALVRAPPTQTFFAYYWKVDDTEVYRTVIRMYGLNKNNENVCVIVSDFTPYAYIELPDAHEWNETRAGMVASKIDELMKDQKPIIKQYILKKRLYYASVDKKGKRKLFPYLMVSFASVKDLADMCKKLYRPLYIPGIGAIKFKIHETNANPVLQMTSLRKIPTAGWISFVGKKVSEDDKITFCQHEYTTKWKTLNPVNDDSVARPLLMGYDIEVYSSVPTAMPNASRDGDRIFQISCIFARQGEKQENYQKYLLTLGKVGNRLDEEGIIVREFISEASLLEGFTELLKEKQPNVCIGHNIFGFDIPYMYDRSKTTGCTYDYDRQGMKMNSHASQKEISWSSSAYGNNKFTYLDAEGRIFVDLLPLVKRDYKLNDYKLKTLAMHFLKDMTKDPLGPQGIFKCYRLGIAGGQRGEKALAVCGKYCVKDSLIAVRLFETLTTWVALVEMSKVTGVPIFALFTQGQQIKVFSQVYRKATHENIVVEKDAYLVKENDHYVGATVLTPTAGVYDMVVPFDFCLGGDTLVSTYSGLSVRIKDIPVSKVFSCDEKGAINVDTSSSTVYKGEKDTVKIFLQDGQEIISTPDHKFMLEDGSWCRADELEGKYVRCGPEFPEDVRYPEEKDWKLDLGDTVFDMSTEENRERSLAYCRLLGNNWTSHILHLSGGYSLVDREVWIRDSKMVNRQGCVDSTDFIFAENCPLSLVREFLAGLFGVIGEIRRKGMQFIRPRGSFNWLIQCQPLLARFGIPCLYGIPRGYLDDFAKKIGFRYAIEKTMQLQILCSYLVSEIEGVTSCFDYVKELQAETWFDSRKDRSFISPIRKRVSFVRKHNRMDVYDIEVKNSHNFIANGVVAHNCSLYPSAIIAYNLCWSTLVTDDSVPDELCHVLKWSEHLYCGHDPRVIRKNEINDIIKKGEAEMKELRNQRDMRENKFRKEEFKAKIEEVKKSLKPFREERVQLNKTKPKFISCCERKYRWLKEPMGVLPEILKHLLDTRGATKKMLKAEKAKLKELNPEDEKYEDLQTYCDVLDQRQNALKISANSVTGDTAIPCQIDGKFCYRTIEELSSGDWVDDGKGGEISSPIQDLKVWSDVGFTEVNYVFRHVAGQKIVRVQTGLGSVKCTEDHSLLESDGKEISPKNLCVWHKLMHKPVPLPENISSREYTKEYLQEYYQLGYSFFDDANKGVPDNILQADYDTRMCFWIGYQDASRNKSHQKELSEIHQAGMVFLSRSIVFSAEDYDQDENLTFLLNKYDVDYTGKYVYDLETVSHHFAAGIGDMIVHNSGYGITGARKGYLTCIPVAMCTTYIGRISIEKAAKTIQSEYKGSLVYGDTDSNYVSFPHLATPQECWDYAVNVAKCVSALFPPPMSLAYEEKIYKRFLILTKKRYMSLQCDRDGKTDTKISKKGVLLQRRDNCNFVRKVYGDVIMMIFDKKDIYHIAMYILDEINKLCSGFYPPSEFIVTKSIRDMGWFESRHGDFSEYEHVVEGVNSKGKKCFKIGDYIVKRLPDDEKKQKAEFKKKNCDNAIDFYAQSFPAQAQLADKMRQRGQLVMAGSRIEYVVTTTGGHTAKQYLKVEDAQYFSRHRASLEIDYLYYLKQLATPLDQVLDVIFGKGDTYILGYPFPKGFTTQQYDLRAKTRPKLMAQLTGLFTPKIKFSQEIEAVKSKPASKPKAKVVKK